MRIIFVLTGNQLEQTLSQIYPELFVSHAQRKSASWWGSDRHGNFSHITSLTRTSAWRLKSLGLPVTSWVESHNGRGFTNLINPYLKNVFNCPPMLNISLRTQLSTDCRHFCHFSPSECTGRCRRGRYSSRVRNFRSRPRQEWKVHV